MDRPEGSESAERTVEFPAAGVTLEADVAVPAGARGIVLFAHGSGSSRRSPRNRYVAAELQRAGLATVLVDLLTAEEEQVDARTAELRFDIGLLAERLTAIADRLAEPGAGPARTAGLAVGLFGASTGAAAALVTAAARQHTVAAVVSRGGRPDLAENALTRVMSPTLLIVGERDRTVLELNRSALRVLPGERQLTIVPDATHLFEEPGALEQVAALSRDWFAARLGSEAR